MKKPKLLVLGGSHFQVPLIERAQEKGIYVITCDYLPDNPGHSISDEYHNVSTTDKESVLELAMKLSVDGVTTLSSDPAIPTVAYVTDKLGLPGPNPESVNNLTEKHRFREVMKKLGIAVPQFVSYTFNSDLPDLTKFGSSLIVKPVDSCGSKGITFCENTHAQAFNALEKAFSFSRSKRCIIEEYIVGRQIHGDGFMRRGRLIYDYLGDHIFYTDTNNFIPISTQWPATITEESRNNIRRQVEAVCNSVGYTDGPVNIEARITNEDKVYLIEIGARNGGNYLPIIQQELTGFSAIDAIIHQTMDWSWPKQDRLTQYLSGAHYILHATRDGIFKELYVSELIKEKIFMKKLFKQAEDKVNHYNGSSDTIGVILLKDISSAEKLNLGNYLVPIIE